MITKKQYCDLTELSERTGLTKAVIKSIIVDNDIPCIEIGTDSHHVIVDERRFYEAFNKVNVNLKIRVLEKRAKNKKYMREWYQQNRESELEKSRERCNESKNTFGRKGHERGQCKTVKRDYELTEEELQRRNNKRNSRKDRNGTKQKGLGVLIWYSGKLNDLTVEEYNRALSNEYNLQYACAARGYIAKKNPSEHFVFDFDLERMLQNGCKSTHGKVMTKWWEGEIRHWTVKDGIWRDSFKNNE